MYSIHPQINILVALLVKHGVRHAVVCPGSRNAPLVHCLEATAEVTCHGVTDERSAGFCALGLWLATHQPTVVCVTSGTALLNLAPAVAEAHFRRASIVVVSADRPEAWIGQLDGQTLPQPGALELFVRRTVSLPQVPQAPDEAQRTALWHTNRLVNEALLATRQGGGAPVHINVPIAAPLYDYATPALPQERSVQLLSATAADMVSTRQENLPHGVAEVLQRFAQSPQPLVVMGQNDSMEVDEWVHELRLKGYAVLHDPLGASGSMAEAALMLLPAESYPSFILYMGEALVSQHAKEWLRRAPASEVWMARPDGSLADVTQQCTGIIEALSSNVLHALPPAQNPAFGQLWETLQSRARRAMEVYPTPYSQLMAVQRAVKIISTADPKAVWHWANSLPIRHACLLSVPHAHCNRGANGIDGTLSTAVGHAMGTQQTVYCVTGDLSFFYDQNALWQATLPSNIRILLINNGSGGIFHKFSALRQQPNDLALSAGQHQTAAESVCRTFGLDYHCAHHEAQLNDALHCLAQATRPTLVEVKTSPDVDYQAYEACLKHFSHLRDHDTPL